MTSTAKTLGILGSGQLGMMSAQAAKKLGIDVVIFTPEENSPASKFAAKTIVAPYEDEQALKLFSEKIDVVSYEFENIPLKTIEYLEKLRPVFPKKNLLAIAQDRIKEKSYLNDHGIPTVKWKKITNTQDIENILKEWNVSNLILKTTRFGYDGKGQEFIRSPKDIKPAFNKLRNNSIIAEEVIDFSCEISVIVSRETNGHMKTYGPMLNEHVNHILSKTIIPSPIPEPLQKQAIKITRKLAESVNLVGVLALEMFVTKDGRILANEIAPRTHNSGHWTIDACETSQFENHVRAVCGLGIATPNRHSDAVMINLIGDDINHLDEYKNNPNAHITLYGKKYVRPGRKMGHVTITTPLTRSAS